MRTQNLTDEWPYQRIFGTCRPHYEDIDMTFLKNSKRYGDRCLWYVVSVNRYLMVRAYQFNFRKRLTEFAREWSLIWMELCYGRSCHHYRSFTHFRWLPLLVFVVETILGWFTQKAEKKKISSYEKRNTLSWTPQKRVVVLCLLFEVTDTYKCVVVLHLCVLWCVRIHKQKQHVVWINHFTKQLPATCYYID